MKKCYRFEMDGKYIRISIKKFSLHEIGWNAIFMRIVNDFLNKLQIIGIVGRSNKRI